MKKNCFIYWEGIFSSNRTERVQYTNFIWIITVTKRVKKILRYYSKKTK